MQASWWGVGIEARPEPCLTLIHNPNLSDWSRYFAGDLITAKEAMGREKDLLTAKELRAIAARRQRSQGWPELTDSAQIFSA